MNYIIKNPASAKYKEKRSEFIAFSKYINNTDDLNEYLKSLKSSHQTARHFCWAYRIYQDNEIIENSSDAGEPSGSAGIPILNTLKSKKIINCAIIVIRYFGGVKLGKKGLIHAYQTVAELVIAEGDITKWEPVIDCRLEADIKFYGVIAQVIQKFNGRIIEDNSSKNLSMIINIRLKNYSVFSKQFNEITQNSGKIKKQSEHDQTKEVRK